MSDELDDVRRIIRIPYSSKNFHHLRPRSCPQVGRELVWRQTDRALLGHNNSQSEVCGATATAGGRGLKMTSAFAFWQAQHASRTGHRFRGCIETDVESYGHQKTAWATRRVGCKVQLRHGVIVFHFDSR
jgi:hypothetical protein